MPLTEIEKRELVRLIEDDQLLPDYWRNKLLRNGQRSVEIGKEYRLVYEGKLKREEVQQSPIWKRALPCRQQLLL